VTATVSSDFATHLAGRSHSRCRMLRLDLKDGTILGFTDHDKSLDFDLSDGDGAVTYRADLGMKISNISLSCGLDSGNCEITAPISDVITLDGILGGRFSYAEARIFEVIWNSLSAGPRKFMLGNTTEWRIEGGKAIAEIRDLFDKYNQTVGRIIENQCDADFGDTRCGATPVTVVGTVTAAPDAFHMTVSFAGSFANDYFNKGTVIGLTGSNASAVMEIDDWTSAGVITLFAPLAEVPAIGDTFTVKQGCGKTRADCMVRGAILNFRGYPEVPGSDQVLRMPTPGAGG
jgi:uncharacterized phage protein (TIGR02218 family)